ncbi:MAG: YbaK/EbsC family protein [Sedimentisphaerales bacterium]|nr:YbaK/EbsC family protein [Sedimentisphaerales bacterium]
MELVDFLKEKHVDFQLCAHRPAFTSQQMAAEEHTPGVNVAKPVIVQADGKYYMCVLSACCKVDLDKLRNQLDAGEVQLVSEKEMAKLFPDCELGAEPPFGNFFGMTTLMDENLGKDGYILFQSGKHDQAVRLKLTDYEKMVHPRIMKFSYHLH